MRNASELREIFLHEDYWEVTASSKALQDDIRHDCFMLHE